MTIVVDPGHGGFDVGAVNGDRYEKDDNLRLGMALRDHLRALGQTVIMTRDSDIFVSLPDRSAISNRNDTDMFVSIHRNSSVNPESNGVENWVYTNASPSTTQAARTVLDGVVGIGVQSDRGIRTANFSVLRNTEAPAMLLEMGFISNDIDNALFDENLDDYAEAIALGVLESLGITPGQTETPSAAVVRMIQNILNERYDMGLAVDGIYGPQTRSALVRALQLELNANYGADLTADGRFGPETKAAIPNLSIGSRGRLVFILQAALYLSGYRTEIDEIFGQDTRRMVLRFQSGNGLAEDGIAGPDTFEALLA